MVSPWSGRADSRRFMPHSSRAGSGGADAFAAQISYATRGDSDLLETNALFSFLSCLTIIVAAEWVLGSARF